MPNRRQRRSDRRRSGGSGDAGATHFRQIPYRRLRNPLAPVAILDEGQIEQIHQASLHILQLIGLDFFDDEALGLWQAAGARVDWPDRHVWLDGEMVLELVARAPARFTWSTMSATRLTAR